MRSDRLIPGTLLVIIGIVFLLDNFGVIDFSWWTFFDLWPILLIIGGVNLVFAHNRSHWATIVKMAVLIAGMAVLIVSGLSHRGDRGWPHWTYRFNRDYNDDNNRDTDEVDTANGERVAIKVDGNSVFREPYHPGLQTAKLNITGGATTYKLSGVTNDLFVSTTKEYNAHYSLKTHIDDSTHAEVNFDMSMHKHGMTWHFNNKHESHADIQLNANPVWDIDLESGASKADFDLSPFKVKNLTIQGGASSYIVKLGQPLATTTVDISTGMASVTLYIPKNAACHVSVDTGLSSKNLDGFVKRDDDSYETPGFDKAANKIEVSFEAGMSNLKVVRY